MGQVEQAITDGAETDGYSSVGLLQAGISGSVGICSGTLIGARTVLTAAHCIEPGETHIFHLAGGRYGVGRVIQHGAWDPKDPRFPNDIGLAILTREPDVEPSAIALSAPRSGMPISLVGFGATAEGKNDAGSKRVTTNKIDEVTPLRFAYTGSGDGIGSTCNGDSGGPAYARVDGKAYQVGITSAGVAPCGTLAWDTRVDVFRDWITANAEGDVYHHDVQAPQVVITAPISGGDVPARVTVTADATDDEQVVIVALRVSGRELQRRSAPPYRFTIDLAPGRQSVEVVAWDAAGNEGMAAVHVRAAVSGDPGKYGGHCASGSDCESGLCAAALDGHRSCSWSCLLDSDCPAGASCGASGQGPEGLRGVCLPAVLLSAAVSADSPELAAGCALGGGDSDAGAPATLLLLLAALWRRR